MTPAKSPNVSSIRCKPLNHRESQAKRKVNHPTKKWGLGADSGVSNRPPRVAPGPCGEGDIALRGEGDNEGDDLALRPFVNAGGTPRMAEVHESGVSSWVRSCAATQAQTWGCRTEKFPVSSLRQCPGGAACWKKPPAIRPWSSSLADIVTAPLANTRL